ncbi:MAG: cytochrome c peroxidase [Candidatus Paceibacteria bacterium]|jgi:cytochrome c peroxidase
MTLLQSLFALILLAPYAPAQLRPAVPPPGNPLTVSKARLGKALFWDEQLSSTGTVSCGTCHMPEAGGSDPRAAVSIHPGADGFFGTPDDIRGSRGVPRASADGNYIQHEFFGLLEQVTPRRAPSAIAAGYSKHLFWDGRAGESLIDPVTGNVVLSVGAALEAQALGPIVSAVEMGHLGRTWAEVITRLQGSQPLDLSDVVPATLAQWIGTRSYSELFHEAFGSNEISAVRIAMAIASYERTLTPNRSPWDLVLAGVPIDLVLTPEERAGVLVFLDPDQANCGACHSTGTGTVRFTDDLFHNIGATPVHEDLGRFNLTGRERDRGAFKTPELRNVELRAPYMHDGSIDSLAGVIAFYDEGGTFDAPNKHPAIRKLDLSADQKRALHAFISRPLTDPRVAAGTFPFDRPSQYADSQHVPEHFGHATGGSAGFSPTIIALEPPKLGVSDLTIGLDHAVGGAQALLLINVQETPGGVLRSGALLYPSLQGVSIVSVPATNGVGPGEGWASVVLSVPGDISLLGTPVFAQWVVLDSGAASRLAATEAIRWSWY